ncbi:hypothetical protein ACWCXH_17175 [Kitasatospora sp. NPDC001660]
MPPAQRFAALGAVLLLLGATTGCSLLAAPGDRTPGSAPTAVPPKQVVLAAAQALDDAGGARIDVVEEGPAGHRTASGTLVWGSRDAADLSVTDELGTGRLTGRDGAFDLVYQGGATKHADRAGAESLDPRAGAAPDGYAGGWTTWLVTSPGSTAYAMTQAGALGSLGGEQLAGMTVAHYQGSAPVADYFGTDRELTPERLAAVLAYYRGLGVTTIGFDIWVGPGKRLLRLRETARGSGGTVVTTTDVSDPGEGDGTPTPTG